MSIAEDTLEILASHPEPDPLPERPLIVYAADVRDRAFMHKLRGVKRNVYWTTAAVAELIEQTQKGK